MSTPLAKVIERQALNVRSSLRRSSLLVTNIHQYLNTRDDTDSDTNTDDESWGPGNLVGGGSESSTRARTIALAVVIPVVVIAILVAAWFYRKREIRRRKEEERTRIERQTGEEMLEHMPQAKQATGNKSGDISPQVTGTV